MVMAKPDKLSHQELLERRKRIPQRTQEILRKMISRRFMELCNAPDGGSRQPKRKAKPYLPEIWLEREPEPEPEMQMGSGEADL
jgi:hypothetical protein